MASGRSGGLFLAAAVAAVVAWCVTRVVDVPGRDHEAPDPTPRLDFFIRSMGKIAREDVDLGASPADLDGTLHYRLAPGVFPSGMGFHFDGLAAVLKFTFRDGRVSYKARPYESQAFRDYNSCIFFGTGTAPRLGMWPCLENPSVNLLPFQGQLWLTIDTAYWGRMDPATLETLPNKVEEVSRVQLPRRKLIQHSHSPCVTPNYLVSKLDAFVHRTPFNENKGMLKFVHQGEDDLWMVMDRRTNVSRVLASTNFSFVNNHFWNCYEDDAGGVVVDAVATTKDYLDGYFARNLETKPAAWDSLFKPALRCRVPPVGDVITCEPLFRDPGRAPLFDYPTFNPAYKMRPDYRYFYAVAGKSKSSLWFDELIKVDSARRDVIGRWSSEGVFLTEADFAARQPGTAGAAEDDGYLLSVLYNSSSDESSLAVFDARTVELLRQYPLGTVVPFHAHGIVCEGGGARCLTNP